MQTVFLIFDIGKTNKKTIIFSEEGNIIEEHITILEETKDEDGFPADDIIKIVQWIKEQFNRIKKTFSIKAINFTAYGASFIHLNNKGKVITPLYNYLKPLQENIANSFLDIYFDRSAANFSKETSSPFLQMLNSGLQLYWLKKTKPLLWKQIKYSVHLPQYLSYLFSHKLVSDYTSIGCHTGLWSFQNNDYHHWVLQEEIHKKLPSLTTKAFFKNEDNIFIGLGLHDSSAALIPYLSTSKKPFLVISTGTWCINLNPFNNKPLTLQELAQDCLCYLQVNGLPVKASRIFLGKEHEYSVTKIAEHFKINIDFYKTINKPHTFNINNYSPQFINLKSSIDSITAWDLSLFNTPQQAYTCLMQNLTQLLIESVNLILTDDIKTIYVDGGFANNKLFKYYLSAHFNTIQIITANFKQATAYGAFLHLKNAINKS